MQYHPIQCGCGYKMKAPREQEGQIVFCCSCERDLYIPKSKTRSRNGSRTLLRCSLCQRIWYGTTRMAGKSLLCPLCEKTVDSNRRKKSARPEETIVSSDRPE